MCNKLRNVPGTEGGEEMDSVSSLLSGGSTGVRVLAWQALNWMPGASGLSQRGRISAEREEACSQEVRRDSWRRERELSFDSWSHRAVERIRPLFLPFCRLLLRPGLVFDLSYFP